MKEQSPLFQDPESGNAAARRVRFPARVRLAGLAAAALLACAGSVYGQNPSTWSGGGGNGNWGNAVNWDVAPLSNNDTELIFGGTQQPITNNNSANPFQLTAISLDSGAINFTLGGNAIQFVPGTNPASISTGSTTGRLLFNANVAFTSATAINLNADNAAGAELWFAGSLTNPVGNTISVNLPPTSGMVMITGKNNTSFAGTWSQSSATQTQLGAINAMWRTTAVSLASSSTLTAGTTTAAGYGVLDAGFNQQIGAVGGAGQFFTGTTASAATVLAGFANTDTTLNGAAGLAGQNVGSHFGKVGTGTLTISNENTAFNAGLSVRQGNLLLNGSLGALVNTAASPGAWTLYGGGQLRVNNTTAPSGMNAQGRLSDTRAIQLAGGTLRLDGPSVVSALGSLEQAGPLRPLAGQSIVVVNANAAQPARFNFASVNVDALARGGQVAFAGDSLGGTPAAGVAGLTFTSAPATINGLIPWALAQAVYTGNTTAATNTFSFGTLAEYGANGVSPLTTFVDNNFSSATQNVRVQTAAAPGTGLANSLTIGNGATLTLTGPLAITSGAIMNRSGSGAITGGSLTAAGRMYLNSLTPFSINSTISAAGLSKGGVDTAIIGAVTLSGSSPVIAVNAGTLTIGGAVTATTPVFQVSKGATLAGVSSIDGTLRGNGTVTGPVNISGRLEGSSLASETLATGGSPGTLAINGALSLTGGGSSEVHFYLSSVFSDTQTQSLITATSLNLSGVTAAAKLSIQPHSLLLSDGNTGNVYDFDLTQNYSWTLIQSATPITGFNAAAFTVNLANFTNPTSGVFSMATAGNNLVLNYSPVPEPGVATLLALGLLGLSRRKARRAAVS